MCRAKPLFQQQTRQQSLAARGRLQEGQAG
jgi:hypothetical protein